MGGSSLLFSGVFGEEEVWVIGGDSIGVVPSSWMTTETVPVIGSLLVGEEGEVERWYGW